MSTLLARMLTRSPVPPLVALGAILAASALPSRAYAAEEHPAGAAMEEVKGKPPQMPVIQNRFFLKSNRFEFAPMLGYVPNNAFVSVPLGGAVLAYHFSESFAVEGDFFYAPNTGEAGVKGLTKTLVDIAYLGNTDTTFKQPLDRPQLGVVFDARWAPVYGKINLIGEGVINFDVYGDIGAGILTVAKDYATANPAYYNSGSSGEENGENSIQLVAQPETAANFVLPQVGIGMDFFLSQSIAIKVDARSLLYVADEPNYGNVDANGNPEPLKKRLYNTFVTTVGVSIFVPKMKPRLYNF